MNKSQLIAALEVVKPGLAKKEMIEQSASFAFKDGRVVTYNDEISVSHPVPGLDISGAIKADELYNLLNRINKDEITLQTNESELRISAGRVKAGITLQQEVRLPLDELGQINKWKKVSTDLREAIKFAMFSCSNDMSSPVLTCVHVCKEGLVESCDNVRLTSYHVSAMPVGSFLIPASSARFLVAYDFTHIAEGHGWVHFKTKDDTIFSCRIFEDNYPNLSELTNVTGRELQLPSTLEDILDRAGVFAKREHQLDEQVCIRLENKKMTIRGESIVGWCEESANIRYDDEPVTFLINPSLLRDIVRQVRTCTLGTNSLKFKTDKWQHVVALHAE